MNQTVNIFCVLSIFLCFLIDHISASNYELVEGYPASVRKIRGPQLRSKSHIPHNLKYIADDYRHSDIQNDGPIVPYRRLKVRHSGPQHPKKHRTCLKCPEEIKATAREGLDGILVIPPAPRACRTDLPFNPNLYKIETLFSPDLPFLLPEGKHKIIGRIRNIETGLVVKVCPLRYNVTVRRCSGLQQIKNKHLRMYCTAGRIWGSKCAFECKNNNAELSHREPIVCNENEEWIGTEPECIEEAMNSTDPIEIEDGNRHCERPNPPANGQFICDDGNEVDSMEPKKYFKSGSVCRVECDETYSIPLHLLDISSIKCKNGSWTSTDIEFCYKKQSKRRHLHRRHDSNHNGSKNRVRSRNHAHRSND